MRLALHSASTPQLTLHAMLETANRYGLEGLDLRIGIGHHHGVELTTGLYERQHFRKLAAQAGIDLACLSISCRYTDGDQVQEQISQTRAHLELAYDLGVPYVRVFAGRIPPGGSREQAKRHAARALQTLGQDARSLGVHVLVETHDDWSEPLIMSTLLKEVNDPHVGVVWDILHTFHEGGAEPEQVYALLGRWIRHVHIHDGVQKTDPARHHPAYVPIGGGDIDHLRVIKLLRQGGYEDYVTGEWYDWEPVAVHLPRELSAFRTLLDEAGGGEQ